MIWARRAHCSCDPPHSSSRRSVIHKYVSQAGRRAGHEPTMSHSVRRSIGSALLPQPSPQHRMGIGPKCVHVNCAVPEGTRVHFLSYPALCLPHPNSRKSGANRGPRFRLRAGLSYAVPTALVFPASCSTAEKADVVFTPTFLAATYRTADAVPLPSSGVGRAAC
jgi:hypothetical protein